MNSFFHILLVLCPFSSGWDERGTSDYGRVIRSYVDEHPPDEFIHVKEGANYGWPFANPNPDKGLDRMPFDPDYETNRNWSLFPETSFTRIDFSRCELDKIEYLRRQ
jgi:hypothetical protein